jgi:ribonuclease HI
MGSDIGGISGRWSLAESQLYINLLELRAIGLALKTFCKPMSDCHILIKSDNQVAVRYINTKGGTHSETE